MEKKNLGEMEMVDSLQLIIAFIALHIAAVSLVFSILSFSTVKRINARQILREEHKYLLSAIVKPYNIIETDIILMAQGYFDQDLDKDSLDKQTLQSICLAKSYSLFTENQQLFDYLDKLISGEKLSSDNGYAEDLGGLINSYFGERPKTNAGKSKSDIKKIGSHLRFVFLNKTRQLRNQSIERLKKVCSVKHK